MIKSVGIVGFGTIGRVVGKTLDNGIAGLELVGIVGRDQQKAKNAQSDFKNPAPVLDIEQVAEKADIIIDCAPTLVFQETAEASIKNNCILITVNAAAILENPGIIEKAGSQDAKIILATGALLGLDAVRAAAEGEIFSVDMITRKPPPSLVKAKYVKENDIDISDINEPLKLFDGTARDGARNFPANVNVAVALGLAGIGPDETHLEIWADPGVTRNTHEIIVDSDSAKLTMKIENIPTEENPGTGRITALSVLATLRSVSASLKVGT